MEMEFDVEVFMFRGISLRKVFWVVNTSRASAPNRFKRLTSNFAHTFLTGCWTKEFPRFFLTTSHSFFILIIRLVLKAYFAWKQLQVDFSKNVWKEENHGHGFVCPLVGYIYVQINYWKLQFCWSKSS